MADYGRCPKCERFGWLPHACKEFECATDWNQDPEWTTVHAMDAEQAVERYAEDYDCEGDYTIIKAGDRGETIIRVREMGDEGGGKKFHVYGESVPQYHARELTE